MTGGLGFGFGLGGGGFGFGLGRAVNQLSILVNLPPSPYRSTVSAGRGRLLGMAARESGAVRGGLKGQREAGGAR